MKLRRAIRFLMRKYMFLLLNRFEPTTPRNALAWSVAVVALPFQAAQAGQRPSGRPSATAKPAAFDCHHYFRHADQSAMSTSWYSLSDGRASVVKKFEFFSSSWTSVRRGTSVSFATLPCLPSLVDVSVLHIACRSPRRSPDIFPILRDRPLAARESCAMVALSTLP
ncbi:hypothetical protein RGR602_PB00027 (plasmid) [Rhizobium gallicum bv. gallicum R602sp]|uniref:Uncharacterized protein n=1 Tax=Rhizobium gallicum bv. gallicum R602sp TaxID=1041138 RepID=A0A0B4X660_9HYPH|nr:hypothetical protein RGR602_PB00027 [Rhizobium gallicum bv. gallicum R602sp]